jgi:hypothetical protein
MDRADIEDEKKERSNPAEPGKARFALKHVFPSDVRHVEVIK